MLNRVRKQFIGWAMVSMTLLVCILAAAINVVNWKMTDSKLESALFEIAQSAFENAEEEHGEKGGGKTGEKSGEKTNEKNGEKSGEKNNEGKLNSSENDGEKAGKNGEKGDKNRKSSLVQYGNRFAMILIPENDESVIIKEDQELITEEEAEKIVELIQRKNKDIGYCYDFKYYRTFDKHHGNVIYILDCSTNISARNSLLLISILVGVGGLVLAFLFILKMSRITVKPVEISIEKQKQFITNAGHELKTPLSAISTNMDILTMDLGANEWVDGTKKQVRKLRKLVENLTSLSKLEEENSIFSFEELSITNLVKECIDSFTGIAELNGKTFKSDIQDDLTVKGDSATIHQMIAILCDNAIKYSSENDEIEIKLYKEGKNVYFQSINSWDNPIEAEKLDILFERFYRADTARTNNGSASYGLGLSIAKAIAEKNNCKISASTNPDNKIVFTICFGKNN